MLILYWLMYIYVFILELNIIISLSNLPKIDKGKKWDYNNTYTDKIVLMIAVYKEEKIIEAAQFFERLTKKHNIHTYFITSDKEIENNINLTKATLEDYVEKNNVKNIHVINSDNKEGNKSTQVNFALDYFNKSYPNDDIIIGMYDCDSRPDLNTIEEVIHKINLYPNASLFQQSSIFDLNFKEVSDYLKVESFFETRWAFGFEKRNQILSKNNYIRTYFRPFYYCVGHGAFIKKSFLNQVGGFPSPNEDVPLGIICQLKNVPIIPLETNDYAEVVSSFRKLLLQSGNWIKAPFMYINVLKKLNKKDQISLFSKFKVGINIINDIISWNIYFLTFIISLLMGFKFIIITISSLFISSLTSYFILKNKSYFPHTLNIYSLLALPFRNILRGLAIFSAIYQKIFGWYYNK